MNIDNKNYGCVVEIYDNGALIVDDYLYQDSGAPEIMIPFLRTILGLTADELYNLFISFLGFGSPDNRTNSGYYTYYVYLDLGIVHVSSSDGLVDYTCSLTDGIAVESVQNWDIDPFKDGRQQLLTVNDVSSILNVKPKTLYLWAETRQIPCFKINGCLRFDLEEIQNWLDTWHRDPIRGYNPLSSTQRR